MNGQQQSSQWLPLLVERKQTAKIPRARGKILNQVYRNQLNLAADAKVEAEAEAEAEAGTEAKQKPEAPALASIARRRFLRFTSGTICCVALLFRFSLFAVLSHLVWLATCVQAGRSASASAGWRANNADNNNRRGIRSFICCSALLFFTSLCSTCLWFPPLVCRLSHLPLFALEPVCVTPVVAACICSL